MSKEEAELVAELMVSYVISNAAQGPIDGLNKINGENYAAKDLFEIDLQLIWKKRSKDS